MIMIIMNDNGIIINDNVKNDVMANDNEVSKWLQWWQMNDYYY